MRNAIGLRAISLATLVAFAGVTAQTVPVAATDPSPSPTPVESPAPSPAESPAPSPSPTPVESPAPSPAESPAPSPSASPAGDPTPSPAPSDAPSPDPSADPAPTPTPTPIDDPAVPAPTPVPDPAATAPATVAPRPNPGARVARIALNQRHKRYVRGADGPRAFDCSGLVRFAYRKAGVNRYLGGGHSARAMLRWARRHGLTSRSHPHVGDVVIYGNGSHAAIYIGHGRVISALNPRQGIRITRLHALTARFTAFIHTHLAP